MPFQRARRQIHLSSQAQAKSWTESAWITHVLGRVIARRALESAGSVNPLRSQIVTAASPGARSRARMESGSTSAGFTRVPVCATWKFPGSVMRTSKAPKSP